MRRADVEQMPPDYVPEELSGAPAGAATPAVGRWGASSFLASSFETPVLPPELGEGDIAGITVVPEPRGPQYGLDFPVEDLALAARLRGPPRMRGADQSIDAPPVRGAFAEPDQPMRDYSLEAPI